MAEITRASFNGSASGVTTGGFHGRNDRRFHGGRNLCFRNGHLGGNNVLLGRVGLGRIGHRGIRLRHRSLGKHGIGDAHIAGASAGNHGLLHLGGRGLGIFPIGERGGACRWSYRGCRDLGLFGEHRFGNGGLFLGEILGDRLHRARLRDLYRRHLTAYVENAQGGFKGEGHHQTERHHQPKEIAELAGCFFHKQTHQQHGQDDHACRQAHVQQGFEKGKHITPPCVGR